MMKNWINWKNNQIVKTLQKQIPLSKKKKTKQNKINFFFYFILSVTKDELKSLLKYYKYISRSIEKEDDFIDFFLFQKALGFSNSSFAARIFEALDETGEHLLGFHQFVKAFSILSPKESDEEKIKCKRTKQISSLKIIKTFSFNICSLIQNLWYFFCHQFIFATNFLFLQI